MIDRCHWKKANMKIKKCTLCCADGVVKFCISYPDPMPLNEWNQLEIQITWDEPKENEITLEFASLNGAGAIRFDSADGPVSRKFIGNATAQATIFGKTVSAKDQDVSLHFKAHDDSKAELKLTVADPKHPKEAESLNAIRQELAIAAEPKAPSDANQQEVWKHYDRMFTDAAAIGKVLEKTKLPELDIPFIDSFKRSTVPKIEGQLPKMLQTGRDPKAKLNAEAMRTIYIFEAFAAKWRGHWRQPNGCGVVTTYCQDHEWRPTNEVPGKTYLRAQDVVMGTDSKPFLTKDAKKCLDGTPGTRDFDTWAINLSNKQTGCIVGAVGLVDKNPKKTDCDGKPRPLPEKHAAIAGHRPHIGFMPRYGHLIWLAEEFRSKDSVNYSLYWEFRSYLRDGRPTYTILGFNFNWSNGKISGLAGRAGQYQIYLDDAAMNLEKGFNTGDIKPEHLDKPVYRRRLEAQPADDIETLSKREGLDAKVKKYLETLLELLRKRDAYNGINPGSRENILFFGGSSENDGFYTSAEEYFKLNPMKNMVAFSKVGNLQDLLKYLRDNKKAEPWGQVNLVTHANPLGRIVTSMKPGDDGATDYGELKRAYEGGTFKPVDDDVLDSHSELYIRGCEIGNSQDFLNLISRAFASKDAKDFQRPTIYAPKLVQFYDAFFKTIEVEEKGKKVVKEILLGAEQSLQAKFFVLRKKSDTFSKTKVSAALKAKYGNNYPGIDWKDALSRKIARYVGDFYFKEDDAGLGFNLEISGAGPKPDLSTTAKQITWLKSLTRLKEALERLGYSYDWYDWEAKYTNAAKTKIKITGEATTTKVYADLLIDLDPVLVEGKPFTLPLSLKDDFEKRNLSAAIRKHFTDRKVPLSDKFELNIFWKNNRWLIIDRKNRLTYSIWRVPGHHLAVYREAWRPILPVDKPGNAEQIKAHEERLKLYKPKIFLTTSTGAGDLRKFTLSSGLITKLNQGLGFKLKPPAYIRSHHPSDEKASKHTSWTVYFDDLNLMLGFFLTGSKINVFMQLHRGHPPANISDFFGDELMDMTNLKPLGDNVPWPNP